MSEKKQQENELSETILSSERRISGDILRSAISDQDPSSLSGIPEVVEDYWDIVRRMAKELKSDGCSMVADIWVDCCYEHDIHWRTGKTIDGEDISIGEANKRFRECMQAKSKLGKASPVALWRWAGVTIRGWFK